VRLIVVRVPDDVYRELEEKARREGYALVADYVKALIMRELGRSGPSLRDLEERLERIEAGELPPPLYERIASIVRSVLQEEGASSIDVEKLLARIERKVHDMINPWTAKVDKTAQQLAEVLEKLEALEEELRRVKEELGKFKQEEHRAERVESIPHHTPRRYPTHYEGGEAHRRRRRTAIEWLREQGVLFESELMRLRDRDAFFEKLRREGALVIELPNERVAVDREFWERFKERIESLPTVREDEIRVALGDQMFKLFQKLKEAGLVYFDARSGSWRVSKNLEE